MQLVNLQICTSDLQFQKIKLIDICLLFFFLPITKQILFVCCYLLFCQFYFNNQINKPNNFLQNNWDGISFVLIQCVSKKVNKTAKNEKHKIKANRTEPNRTRQNNRFTIIKLNNNNNNNKIVIIMRIIILIIIRK